MPRLASCFFISWSSVTTMRAPEHPTGCPRAMAPPFTFTRSASRPSSAMQGNAWAANASFNSARSMSEADQPCLLNALRVARMGPTPMRCGSRPAIAPPTTRAIGSRPSSLPFSSETTRRAAAPSLMPEELPAVTVPSFWNTGRRRARDSAVVSARGCSSAETMTGSPLR